MQNTQCENAWVAATLDRKNHEPRNEQRYRLFGRIRGSDKLAMLIVGWKTGR